MDDFIMVKTPQELLYEELVCFQTKFPVKEATLGIGISLKKSPRTGLCMYVNPTLDLMSMRAFSKLKVRRDLSGARFTHWFPLYFGEKEVYTLQSENYDEEEEKMVTTEKKIDTYERFEKHLANSLSFIANGSTKKAFNHESVLEVMPKLIATHIIDMMKQTRHISIIAIRRMFNFIRILLLLIDKDSKIQEIMEQKLKDFMTKPETQHKDVTKALIDIQVYSLFAKNYDRKAYTETYCNEQLDRQVLWILRIIPELDFENKKLKNRKSVNEKERSKVSFQCGKTGFYLSMFFFHLNNTINKVVGETNRNFESLVKAMDENHGCLSTELENELQKNLFSIQEVEDFYGYYRTLGIKNVSNDKELNDKLIQAVKNSRQKGYHGQECDANMPALYDQSEERVQGLLSQISVLKIEKEILERQITDKDSDMDDLQPKQKQHVKSITLKDSLKNANDSEWKKLCISNFDFIKQQFESNKDQNITAANLAQMADHEDLFGLFMTSKDVTMREDKLYLQRQQNEGKSSLAKYDTYTVSDEYDSQFNFKKLFLKLTFEFLIRDLQFNKDFEMIYEFIKAFGKDLTSVNFKVIDKSSLKSNHYWLMAIIPKLTSMKSFKLFKQNNLHLGPDSFKFLLKAFTYFQKNGGSLNNF